ncbi:MAG: N-acetylmannosamine-6-phosphate 2-epimerase [Candidatus Hadarchaeum sp.]
MGSVKKILDSIRGGLIVSCQAPEGSPLGNPAFMAAVARAVERGGAVGIRANGPDYIKAIKEVCSLPIIGIYKRRDLSSTVYITPDFSSAEAIIKAGADIVALDGTQRPRPGGMPLPQLVNAIKAHFDVLVMADIATLEEALFAQACGVDLIATTLAGYTQETAHTKNGPDIELVGKLAKKVKLPIIAEGRYRTPAEVCQAISAGAYAVVVGTAITNPEIITGWFVDALRKACPKGQQ